MPRLKLLIPLVLLLVGGACQGTTVPENRELLGSWVSSGVPDVSVRMTVTETARSVAGAGSWVSSGEAHAFGVSGAVANDEVALLFEFDGRADVSFQGFFSDEDVLEGFLTGGGMRRAPVTFSREDLLP